MEIAKANIVRSEAGRDKGKLFFVLNVDGEYLLLADGKERKAERPKRKKQRHVRFVSAGAGSQSGRARPASSPAGPAETT